LSVVAIAHKNPKFSVCGGATRPDIGELGFLLHLQEIIEGVRHFHSPGATFTVLTEGEFYQRENIFDISPEESNLYESEVRDLAEVVSDGGIRLISLASIVAENHEFEEEALRIKSSLGPDDIFPFIKPMEKSSTKAQLEKGVSAENMAYSYVALHRAKYGFVQSFLNNHLGQNFIYCSLTDSNRSGVLRIDPYAKGSSLPQHGIGVLQGGTAHIIVKSFEELRDGRQTLNLGAIRCEDRGPKPFGVINFGRK